MRDGDIREIRVREVMHADWPTLAPQDTVEGAIKLFAESGISGAPVVEGGRLVGIVTEGDLIFRDAELKAPGFLDILGGIVPLGNWEEYRRETLKSAGITAGEVMTDDVTTVSPDDTLAHAATLMAEKRIKLLPVVERTPEGDAQDAALLGVVTRMDILTLHVLEPRF